MTRLSPAFTACSIAHRGLHGAGRPENGLAAVRAAAAGGYGVEIDVQLSADGEAMVFHDAALDRMTDETGPLSQRDAAALGRIALRGGDGETIPTLAQVMAAAAGAPLLVEIKDRGGALHETGVGPLEARASALARDYGGPVALMSFNPYSAAALRAADPTAAVGLVAAPAELLLRHGVEAGRAEACASLATWDAAAFDFISYYWKGLTDPRVAALRASGAPLLCWTTRSLEEHECALAHADAATFEGYAPPKR